VAAVVPNPTRLLPRAERRRSIVTGAARAFAAGGFDATSMEDIAEAAGVTKIIVYRHFESKEELYRSILHEASGRLADQVAEGIGSGRLSGVIVAAFLAVAREDPDGFRLLWEHSRREARFAGYVEEVRTASVAFARDRLAGRVADPRILEWAAPLSVGFLVEAVLTWLDHGDAAADLTFVELTTASIESLITAWERHTA
jgi:AcrR family transcriptional regulator